MSISAVLLFAFQLAGWGHALLVLSLLAAHLVNRELGKDLLLIGVGVAIVSATSVEADVSWDRFLIIGTVLILAVTVPLLMDRLVYRRRAIKFPWRGEHRWSRLEIIDVVAVPFLGWAILPFYFIRSGAYLNWPHCCSTPSSSWPSSTPTTRTCSPSSLLTEAVLRIAHAVWSSKRNPSLSPTW